MRRGAGYLFLLLVLFVTACDQPEPVTMQVGDHDISVLFPQDWEHFDFGQQHQWRQDFQRIAIQDYGKLGSDIDLALERALVKLREDGRREKASRDTLEISGREARMIDTWEHLSHQYRKRYLFVINDRKLLVLFTMQGQFELMETAFTELATSLAFVEVDTVEQPGLGGGSGSGQVRGGGD